MQIELTPEQSAFVDLGIREGRFRNSEEAIQQALAHWEKRERNRVELLASLEISDKEIDSGGGETYNADDLSGLVEDVRSRGMQRLSETR
jgi:Arc/MetJ-type ribon-helix-helix transcriptional regulator